MSSGLHQLLLLLSLFSDCLTIISFLLLQFTSLIDFNQHVLANF